MKTIRYILWVVALVGPVLAGCVQPGELDQSIVGRYQRTISQKGPQRRGEERLDLLRPAEVVQPPLKTVQEEAGGKARIFLSLDEAVMRALANSPAIRVVAFDPSISRQEMVKAAAEFDYVVFGSGEYQRQDLQPNGGLSGGQTRIRTWTGGIRQKTVTGAQWQLSRSLIDTLDDSAFAVIFGGGLQHRYEDKMMLELTQPLLRGAWPDFNLAGVRVARLNYAISMAEFRRQVEQTVTDVIGRYWAVVLARRERMIQQELLDRTIETRDRIDKRRLLDATEVEFMQSEAAVATRRAGLIRAGKLIIDAQDDLARLLADSQLNVLSDREIVPTTPPNVEPVRLDMTDQLITALRYNPILEQARKATAIAAINVTVAKSETLPRLDLRASTTFHGLAGSVHQAGENLETGDFIGHQIAIEAEYPIGNRQRIANLRAQRLGQLKAIATLQSIADQVAVQLRERIRQVETAYEEMKAQKLAVGASRNQLEALDATEQLRGLTPEFLQVKLNAQESLANAERAELRATIDYNVALVEVARAAGTVLELNRVRIAMPATPQDATDQHAPLPTSEPSK